MTSRSSTHANLFDLLRLYLDSPEEEGWVAATVLTKSGSSYRKPGAMMLVHPLGKTFGLVSGGCLEADVKIRAQRVLEYGRPDYVIYDSSEDGNIAAELGLGCNGRIGVLIQQLESAEREIYTRLSARMTAGARSVLAHCYQGASAENSGSMALLDEQGSLIAFSGSALIPAALCGPRLDSLEVEEADDRWASNLIKPPVRLWVIGGGVDARPVVEVAAMLGWRVTVIDHRMAYARSQDFPGAGRILRKMPDGGEVGFDADAVVLMTHNQTMDADWLAWLSSRCDQASYVGLLGPRQRKNEVFDLAGVDPASAFAAKVHGPMGLDIGGDLPESIAVSVIAQCHQQLAAAGRV